MKVAVERTELHFTEPLATSYGMLERRELVILTLTTPDGLEGRGEAAPLEPYDGVGLDDVEAALDACGAALAAADVARGSETLDACRAVSDLPQALAAVDLALWDLAGRRAGRPVAELLADHALARIPVAATIGASHPEDAADQAARATGAGFRTVKVKVGTTQDVDRVSAVRAAVGPQMAIRLDANGVWSVDEALEMIDELVDLGIELVEEPVRGVGALREVRAGSRVRIAMDESGAEPGAVASGATDAISLKIARCGGISGLLAQAALAATAGTEVYVGSTFDGPLGIAAGIHAAAALAPDRACGLGTLDAFADSEPTDALRPQRGVVQVPRAPGLGVA
jgi:o-succinylbenzoate synthase